MGIYKAKTDNQDYFACVYVLPSSGTGGDQEGSIIRCGIDSLDKYDVESASCKIPKHAIDCHNDYYDNNRWYEEGWYNEETGAVEDDCFHHLDLSLTAPLPIAGRDNDPGKC